jgi:hypothetical protein
MGREGSGKMMNTRTVNTRILRRAQPGVCQPCSLPPADWARVWCFPRGTAGILAEV